MITVSRQRKIKLIVEYQSQFKYKIIPPIVVIAEMRNQTFVEWPLGPACGLPALLPFVLATCFRSSSISAASFDEV